MLSICALLTVTVRVGRFMETLSRLFWLFVQHSISANFLLRLELNHPSHHDSDDRTPFVIYYNKQEK